MDVSDELVTVASYHDAISADIARNFLESEGLQAFVTNEASATTFSGIAEMLGGVKIQVPTADADRARELLAQHASSAITDEDVDESDDEDSADDEQPLPGDPESGQELLDA